MGERATPAIEATLLIREMVERIVARFAPERIILFGSHARGTAGPNSDADLLVVMRFQGSRRKIATEMDCALLGIDLPADLIVLTPEEVEQDRDRFWSIGCAALMEGRVLYERPA